MQRTCEHHGNYFAWCYRDWPGELEACTEIVRRFPSIQVHTADFRQRTELTLQDVSNQEYTLWFWRKRGERMPNPCMFLTSHDLHVSELLRG